MSEKMARKFEKLRTAYDAARKDREAATTATREVKALNGETLTLSVLASKAGAKAVEAELAALREERRALKKLAAYALRHADAGKAPKNGAGPAIPASKKGNDGKAGLTGTAKERAKAATRPKGKRLSARGSAKSRPGKPAERAAGQD